MKLPDLIAVTRKVSKVFEKYGIRYYIGGSLASSAFGMARATLDVDIVADIKLERATDIVRHLQNEFYIDIDMIRNAIQRRSFFNLIHFETMFKIDVFILKNRPFERQAIFRRQLKAVSEGPSLKLYFSSPEDIILAKLEWYKSGEEASDRQWNDILGVMKVQGERLDMVYLKLWAGRLGVVRLLNKAIHEAGIFI